MDFVRNFVSDATGRESGSVGTKKYELMSHDDRVTYRSLNFRSDLVSRPGSPISGLCYITAIRNCADILVRPVFGHNVPVGLSALRVGPFRLLLVGRSQKVLLERTLVLWKTL